MVKTLYLSTVNQLIKNRNEIGQQMRDINIEVQIGSYALHKHSAFAYSPYCWTYGSMFSNIYAFERCLILFLYYDIMSYCKNAIKSIKELRE
jgi:hypothetical protein